jgi:hypothetical protein
MRMGLVCAIESPPGRSPMPCPHRSDGEDRRKYLENRENFPLDELARYRGQWIAWSPDGSRIVAHADDPAALDELVRRAGEDIERCITEGIPEEDAVFHGGLGAEWS